MKFDWSSCAVGVIAGIGAALCIIFAFRMDVLANTAFCTAGENGLTCARNWANAIAIIAAGGTVFLLLQQVKEQSKQTAFLLGDADPTFDVFSDEWRVVYLRVINWNRRTCIIERIDCRETSHIVVDEILQPGQGIIDRFLGRSLRFEPGLRIDAFLNRSGAPSECTIKAFILEEWNTRQSLEFVLHIRLLGEEHQSVVLLAKAEVDFSSE